MIRRNPELGRFIGESHQLLTEDGDELTPDISSLFNSDRCGLTFEIKYSVGSSVDDYLLKAKRYRTALRGWPNSTGKVEATDVVLVCNANDTQRVLNSLSKLSQGQDGEGFFVSPGFSVWQWIMGLGKENREESMWLQRVYGKTRNPNLEKLADTPGGVRITEDVLRYLRFQHAFVRDKPPVQYTIVFLVQHVLPKQPDVPSYDIGYDTVYDRANSFFPGWWEAGEKTVQIKKAWIREALDQMAFMKYTTKVEPELYRVPTSLIGKKKLLEDICNRLGSILARQTRQRKQVRSRHGRKRLKQQPGTGTLDKFIPSTGKNP